MNTYQWEYSASWPLVRPYTKSEHFNPCDPIIDLFLFSHFKCGLRRTDHSYSIDHTGTTLVITFSVAMFLAFVFPETNGAPNLTTIDEALLFYKGELTADKDDENEKFLH